MDKYTCIECGDRTYVLPYCYPCQVKALKYKVTEASELLRKAQAMSVLREDSNWYKAVEKWLKETE